MINTLQKCQPIILITLGALLALVLALFLRGANPALGDSPGSTAANNSSTTNFSIGTTAVRIFSTSTCAARIVSTNSSNGTVNLTFNDAVGQRPTLGTGHVHATTTSTSYGGQDYGCGAGFAISTSLRTIEITVTETY